MRTHRIAESLQEISEDFWRDLRNALGRFKGIRKASEGFQEVPEEFKEVSGLFNETHSTPLNPSLLKPLKYS